MSSKPSHRQATLLAESKSNQTVKRWAKVLNKMPEVKTKSKMQLMASILENQHAHMIGDGKAQSSLLTENSQATTTGNIADFTRFALPLLRKSYPKLISDNLSVFSL